MSRHSLTIYFDFYREDHNDPESQNNLYINQIQLDNHLLESKVSHDSQVEVFLGQGIMRIHNLKQKAKV